MIYNHQGPGPYSTTWTRCPYCDSADLDDCRYMADDCPVQDPKTEKWSMGDLNTLCRDCGKMFQRNYQREED